jgi:hypothetical protein
MITLSLSLSLSVQTCVLNDELPAIKTLFDHPQSEKVLTSVLSFREYYRLVSHASSRRGSFV